MLCRNVHEEKHPNNIGKNPEVRETDMLRK